MNKILQSIKRKIKKTPLAGIIHVIIANAKSQGIYLTYLANLYGSDKGTVHREKHNYTRHYHRYFDVLRHRPIRFLEIGLCRGLFENWAQDDVPSIRMWLKYFPQAVIYGYDISDFSFFCHDRFRFFQGDQGSREDLIRFAKTLDGPLDIILEDGSHASHHQQISLGVLFPYLKPGGVYIIEDLHWQPPEIEKSNASKTIDILKKVLSKEKFYSEYLTPEENDYLNSNIDQVDYFSGQRNRNYLLGYVAIITKKA